MAKQDPLFMDFTWGAGGTTSELTLDSSKESQARHGVMVNMRTRRAARNTSAGRCSVQRRRAIAIADGGDRPWGRYRRHSTRHTTRLL